MKKILNLMLAAALFAPLAACAGDGRPVEYSALPKAARTLVEGHFTDKKPALVTRERDLMETTYDLHFTDGTSLEFNGDGEWKEIECRASAVPSALIPAQLRHYLEANYPDRAVVGLSRDRRGWDVELAGGMELEFNPHFQLIEMD